MKIFSSQYWNQRYLAEQTGWDIGDVSTPLKAYFDQLTDNKLRILVPGAGNAWEVEYLFNKGFQHTFLLDFAGQGIANFRRRCPVFPETNIIKDDFFRHQGNYDLVVEQTFFSSIPPQMRPAYAGKVHQLLKPGGKLVGLLFNTEFGFEGPPFGGTEQEYRDLFAGFFGFEAFKTAYNSIKPRQGRELFLLLRKS
ncbi:MAG: TPMT family class I SAM-dependent methyltransferase [Bacteroidales bacterium]|nr:TPMT family class I SAM-dependent methyltransferase [Bacteroidales bacterium]MCF6341934.1 TPMT family class I SAM-dependent methyltransferase [Bacteroidales bacterium]